MHMTPVGKDAESYRACINKLRFRYFITHYHPGGFKSKQDYSVRGTRILCVCVCVFWMGRGAGHWIHREENVTVFS